MSMIEDDIIYDITDDDIRNLCRLCLISNIEMESLYSPVEEIFEDDVTTLFDVMGKLSSTKLSNDPKYPSHLCFNCVSLLNIAYKVNRLLEISQIQLSTFFKEDLQVNKIEASTDSDIVEIISDKGKYNLKDILIIEEDEKQKSNFEGFLNNLGSVISADFVTKNSTKKKCKEDEIHIVNIIPLPGSEEQIQQDFNSEATELEQNKDPPEIKQTITKDKTRLRCTDCGKIFKTKGKLYGHKEMVHGGTKSYLCQKCGHITATRTSLANHMFLKHQGKRFSCEVCGKKYLSNSHLQYHMVVHKNERLHLCTVCGKNFNYGSSLEYHMRIHTGEKKYKCNYCDRGFSMRCGLNRHLRVHTGLRPYKCSFCDKAFRSKGEADCHEMLHTGYRPHHCKLCGKGFTKTHNLKVHMLGHAGPFLCEFCQKGFTEATYLKFHMKLSHGLTDYDVSDTHILIVQEDGASLDLDETLITE